MLLMMFSVNSSSCASANWANDNETLYRDIFLFTALCFVFVLTGEQPGRTFTVLAESFRSRQTWARSRPTREKNFGTLGKTFRTRHFDRRRKQKALAFNDLC